MFTVGTALLTALLLTTGPVSDERDDRDAGLELPEAPATTTSVGHPYHGRLRDGIRLPVEGPHHQVQRSTRKRDWVYGTGYLVRGILTAAATVRDMMPGGQPLILGNLSRRGGGDINMSMSHNSGRDVDIAYYTADAQGRSVESKYHRFGPSGRSRTAPARYHLDIERNWAFVKAVLINQEFEVQWVIVAPWIERLLVQHARDVGEHPDTVRQVQRLMMQPSWAKPHDNHIHLRVLCSPRDWARGCKNAGPVWPWNTRMLRALDAAKAELKPQLASRDVPTRLKALATLRQRGIDTAVVDAAALIMDTEPRVQRAAIETVVALTTEATAPTVLKAARWLEGSQAAKLIEHALPMSGIDGLEQAGQLIDETHPILQTRLRKSERKRLRKLAHKLVKRYGASVVQTETSQAPRR